MWLLLFFFATQYNLSLSSFVPNFRILSQVVAEKSLTEKKVYRQTDKHNNRKDTYKLRTGGITILSFGPLKHILNKKVKEISENHGIKERQEK